MSYFEKPLKNNLACKPLRHFMILRLSPAHLSSWIRHGRRLNAMSRTVMAALEYYSGTWADEISREQTRKVRAPPHRVDLAAYSGIKEEIVVVTVQADAMFVHG